MARVAVIGGGIAGLTAAYRLMKEGMVPVIFEASDRAGGVIRSERDGGFLFEHGPNSIQASTDALETLVQNLDLVDARVSASDAARVRYIVKDGVPVEAPTAPHKLLSSELFRAGAKLRLLREPFVPPADPEVEESVADFTRRRLGPDFLDYAMDPFVAGVYAGDPETLSVQHAFPSLYEMEQSAGSIIKGQISKRLDDTAAAETHRMFSFRNGLECLPRALAEALAECLRPSAPVHRLHLHADGWTVHARESESAEVDAVVFAAPLHALRTLATPRSPHIPPLTDVDYPPLGVVALGYRREHVHHPLDGFGLLVPRVESAFRILGTLFTSSIFPNRAPDGHVLLTTFIGGMRRPEMGTAPSVEAYGVVERDLTRLLDISGEPVLRKHVIWERSIPQYTVGYASALDAMDRLEETWPGWFMAGNYRTGVSVGAAVDSGADAARRCTTFLAS
ncbi:MAG: protoporphyrinogen oxidase [Rhodothermales bacterium]